MRDARRASEGPGGRLPSPEGASDLAELLAASGDVAYSWDLDSDEIHWRGDVGGLFRCAAAACPGDGATLNGHVNPEDLPRRLKEIDDHLGGGADYDCEFRLRAADGRFVWVHDRGGVVRERKGRRLTGILRVVTARKEREAHLEYLANYDTLTGRFNRQRLCEALDSALSYAIRYDVQGAYLQVGIDNLGMVNTVFGYETADSIIVAIGERLDRSVRASDVVGRVGGDRFGVLLGHCPESALAATAEKILKAAGQESIETPNGAVHVTVSIGVVSFPGVMRTAHDVMNRAEDALAEAKGSGRNCFVAHTPSEKQRSDHALSMDVVKQVQTALKDDSLLLAYQPVVDARTHAVDHYECLMRMQAPDGSLIPAAHFVPVVEQMGLIKMIDRRALELAVEELDGNDEIQLAVNISGLTAGDRSWLQHLVALLRNRPEIAARLILEITETAALHEIEESAKLVARMRDLGCRVALDDFGAGHTSLRYIKFLNADSVKIDGYYVRNVSTNLDNQLFVRTLLGMAQSFGLATVAECVETAEDADILARQGLDFLQGYYFGRPAIERPWRDAIATPAAVLVAEG